MQREKGSPQKGAKKKTKYLTNYNQTWEKEFSFLTQFSKTEAHCSWCKKVFRIGGGGRNDITRHCATARHQSLQKANQQELKINSVFSVGSHQIDVTTTAEGLFSQFIASHNISLNTANHFTKLVRVMFPDSKIAERFSAGRTKVTAMVKHALAPAQDRLVEALILTQSVGLMVDEFNDKSGSKKLVILVRVYDEGTETIQTKFLDMPECTDCTAQGLFNLLDSKFRERGLDWSHIIAFNSDNCSVTKEQNNDLKAKIREVQPHVVDVGCICHLTNLVSEAVLERSPINVTELLCDICTHFSMSSERSSTPKEFQQFCELEEQNILKQCPTQWLSVHRCLTRLIDQYPAVKSYFTSHEDCDKPRSKVYHISTTLNHSFTLAWLLFLKYALEPLIKFNAMFQSEKLLITKLHQSMVQLHKRYLIMFVKQEYISELGSVSTNSFTDRSNQLPDSSVCVGQASRLYVAGLDDDVEDSISIKFYSNVRTFLETITINIAKLFPHSHEMLKFIPVIVEENKTKYEATSIANFGRKMGFDAQTCENLETEFLDYVVAEPTGLAPEKLWGKTSMIERPSLTKLMRSLMCIPHSNVSSERVFGMLRKIDKDDRRSMAASTLVSLMSVKINSMECHDSVSFTPNVLKDLKKSAHKHNEQYAASVSAASSSQSLVETGPSERILSL